MSTGKKRALYAAAFAALLATEVCIALFVHDRFVRPYVGDVLVIPLIACLLRVVLPEKVRALPVLTALFGAAVEGLQAFGLPELLGLEDSTAARIILGSTFDPADIVCYCVGGALMLFAEWLVRRAMAEKEE